MMNENKPESKFHRKDISIIKLQKLFMAIVFGKPNLEGIQYTHLDKYFV